MPAKRPMEFQFIPPEHCPLRERRKIRRGLQAKLIRRMEAQTGQPVKAFIARPGGECKVRLASGLEVPLGPLEAQAWQAAVEWEVSGDGEVPRLPSIGL
jgi:hypothetical protein